MTEEWLTTDYDYSGNAEIRFEEPAARFVGRATVRPDETGSPAVQLAIEESAPAITNAFDLLALAHGSQQLADGAKSIAIGAWGPQNKAHVKVVNPQGAFASTGEWNYEFSDPHDSPFTLRVSPTRSEFVVSPPVQEAFLVLPLSDFDADYPMLASSLTGHPLLLGGDEFSKSRSISFVVDGQQGFIQELPAKWRAGTPALTAVAVIPLADPSWGDPWGWFLTVFLRLLELGSGLGPSVPWIETRSAEGSLIRRLHIAMGRSVQRTEGYSAMRHRIHWHNGDFLSRTLSSPMCKEPFFSIALGHCCNAGRPNLSLDDQLCHMIRAFECLCKFYGFSAQDLSDSLDASTKAAISGALKRSQSEIRSLVSAVTDASLHSQIVRISERARGAAQSDRSFGLAVEDLIRHFGLLDADVLKSYHEKNPRNDGRDWIGCLSYYRGAVFHEGYLDVSAPGTPIGHLLGFIHHLHDLLIRVLFKIVGYTGKYQPRLHPVLFEANADWFKPGIPLDYLLKIPTMDMR